MLSARLFQPERITTSNDEFVWFVPNAMENFASFKMNTEYVVHPSFISAWISTCSNSPSPSSPTASRACSIEEYPVAMHFSTSLLRELTSASISRDKGLLERPADSSPLSPSPSSFSTPCSAVSTAISESSSLEESSIVFSDSASGSHASSAGSEPPFPGDPPPSSTGSADSLSGGARESDSFSPSGFSASSLSGTEDAIDSPPTTSFATSAKATLGRNAKLKTKARVLAITQSTTLPDRRPLHTKA